jgi:hypothetical protein
MIWVYPGTPPQNPDCSVLGNADSETLQANPNAKSGSQFHRPIKAAANSRRASIVKLLLSSGADISPALSGGGYGTALHVTSTNGNIEFIQALLDAGHELGYIATGIGHPGYSVGSLKKD